MSNLGNDVSAERTVVTLAEAAKIASCDQFELLRSAALSKIQVFLPTPKGVDVYSIDERLLGLENADENSIRTKRKRGHLAANQPIPCPDIAFLILTPENCKHILERGMIRKSVFNTAIRFDDDSHPVTINAPINTKSNAFGIKPSSYAIYQRFSTRSKAEESSNRENINNFLVHEIEIRVENLSIATDDLNIFLRLNNRHQPTLEKASTDIKSRMYESHHSDELETLYHIARKIWFRTYLDSEKYPSNAEVAKELMVFQVTNINTDLRYLVPHFNSKSAMHCASVIRPKYANGTPTYEKQENRESYLTDRFLALVDASDEFFKNFNQDKYPKIDDIEKSLRKAQKLSDHLVVTGARIILGSKRKKQQKN